MPQGLDFGALGMPRGFPGRSFIFEYGHVAYQIDGDDQHNRMQEKCSPLGQTGNIGVRSRGQRSLSFSYKVNFKEFYAKLCVCSHK